MDSFVKILNSFICFQTSKCTRFGWFIHEEFVNTFNETFFALVSLGFLLPNTCSSIYFTGEPHRFCSSRSREITRDNNEEMAFLYTEIRVLLALLVQEKSYEDSVGHRHSAGECFMQK